MTMKKVGTATLTGTGVSDKLRRGDLAIPAGKALRGIFAKIDLPLANASGSNVTLSDTQKQSLMGGYSCTLTYGAKATRKPFNAIKLTYLQRISRELVGQDFEGYTDSTDGLGRTFTNGATVTGTLWAYIPTSLIWHKKKVRKLLTAGRTQAKSMEIEISRDADTLPSGVTVDGNVTVTFYPDTVDSAFDHWLYLPEYYQVNETGIIARGPVGLHIFACEDSAVLTSTTLTNVEARFAGKKPLYSQVSPVTAYKPTLQVPNIPSEADTADRWTVLYRWGYAQELEELPVGAFELEQLTKDLTTFQLRGLYLPLVPEREVNDDIEWASGKNGRNKVVKAINTAVVMGVRPYQDMPEEHFAFTGFVLVDSDRPEFARYAGKVGKGDNLEVEIFVPDSVKENAQGLIAQAELKGEGDNAEQVRRVVALAVPGAVQDPEGFRKAGSGVLDGVRVHLAS